MDTIKVVNRNNSLILSNKLFSIGFTKESAGFPASISFNEKGEEIIKSSEPYISAILNKNKIIPFLEKLAPEIITDKEKTELTFNDIRWKYADGKIVEGYRLAIAYEIYNDGAAFAKTFFFAETLEKQKLEDFNFQFDVKIPSGNKANWAYWKCPSSPDASIIQDLSNFKRNIPEGENSSVEKGFYPFVSFDYGKGALRDKHIEFFFESWNSLTPDYKNTSTSVKWAKEKARVSWCFQKESRQVEGRAFQWRNIWGWCIRKFPVKRKNPPFRAFHYLDKNQFYPTDKCIKQLAAEGTNLFILHENWSFDTKQGEFSRDDGRLRKVIKLCRKYKMRTMLYVRGNEDGMRFGHGTHLVPRFLKKDYDGIYMDYCAAPVFISKDEYSPGGRIQFYEFDRLMRLCRKTVGDDGVLIGHAGPFFSALGFTQLDAYLGGEQEKGALLQNTSVHAYFSGLAITQASLWTAAFPTYRTKKMLPFMASSFQFPFLHLGVQHASSSLAHPQAPSLVTFARPLWRLWELFDGIKNIRTYSTQNRPEYFNADSESTGASAMLAPDGDTLIIAANYLDKARKIKLNIDFTKLGINGKWKSFKLNAEDAGCDYEKIKTSDSISCDMSGYGIMGFLFVRDDKKWLKRLDKFMRPYPKFPEEEKEHREMLSNLKKLRFGPPSWKKIYIKPEIKGSPDNFEDSLIYDLYNNVIELRELFDDGTHKRLAYLTPSGLKKELPSKSERLYPWSETAWIPLHEFIRHKGPAKLAFATRRGDGEFYSFLQAKVSDKAEITEKTYEISYNNDIDLDWSVLTFNINLD
ncbi:MAG: hypothetical protein A2017_03310 [Lentisphaerae bacterium GWF2_44_16]|nr:MAG: hypothetical protein A2017_03310 [Lentisphaerae bacterium GWF2_44_16]